MAPTLHSLQCSVLKAGDNFTANLLKNFYMTLKIYNKKQSVMMCPAMKSMALGISVKAVRVTGLQHGVRQEVPGHRKQRYPSAEISI